LLEEALLLKIPKQLTLCASLPCQSHLPHRLLPSELRVEARLLEIIVNASDYTVFALRGNNDSGPDCFPTLACYERRSFCLKPVHNAFKTPRPAPQSEDTVDLWSLLLRAEMSLVEDNAAHHLLGRRL